VVTVGNQLSQRGPHVLLVVGDENAHAAFPEASVPHFARRGFKRVQFMIGKPVVAPIARIFSFQRRQSAVATAILDNSRRTVVAPLCRGVSGLILKSRSDEAYCRGPFSSAWVRALAAGKGAGGCLARYALALSPSKKEARTKASTRLSFGVSTKDRTPSSYRRARER
jgi:hypothetical protein